MSPEKRVDWIRKQLHQIEGGGYQETSIHRICDYIDWLWRFRKIDERTMNELTDKAIEVMPFAKF